MNNRNKRDEKKTRGKKPPKTTTGGTRDKGQAGYLLAAGAAAVLEAVVCGILGKQDTDRILAMVFFGIFGSSLWALAVAAAGKTKQIRRSCLAYAAVCIGMIALQRLPVYLVPMLALALVLSLITFPFAGMMGMLFHGVLCAVYGKGDMYLLICYLMLMAGGCTMAFYLRRKTNEIWNAFFAGIYTFGCILVFSYLQTSQLEQNVLSYGVCGGIIGSLCVFLLSRLSRLGQNKSEDYLLEKILFEDYELVQAIRGYSPAAYAHARRVSNIARDCAKLLEADGKVAAAAGFYYRLGRMEGEPCVENGVLLAKSNHFPERVIRILGEYNGEQRMPSSVESAIVHIVDSVVAKFELLDQKTLSDTWNQDILVYQTLNENSAAGLYDKAGFSMNMFLKIRDYLIKEAELS